LDELMAPVDREVLSQHSLTVAPLLLGATLVSTLGGEPVAVRITEVEAYEGADDPASHAFHGPTKRNAVMFGPAGHLYCYFVYGMHWCANITCGPVGVASAVLLRGAEIVGGLDRAQARGPNLARSVKRSQLASGPARLARSMGLNGAQTGIDLLDDRSSIRLTSLGPEMPYLTGPRVGVAVAAEWPWRFWLDGEPSVSSYRKGRTKAAPETRQTSRRD
jgi:DNA-3-methyladenine glycosylase